MTDTVNETDEILNKLLGRIESAEDIKVRRKVMVFGDPGTRKSTFLGTAPKNLIIDVEGGLSSLKNHPDRVDLSQISILPFKSFYQVETLVQKAEENPAAFEQWDTFSVDSVSDLHKKGLAEVMKAGYERGGRRSQYVAETEDDNDHAENNEHIRQLVDSLRSLDKNVILTAHARYIERNKTVQKIMPDFSEKLANTIMGMMDVVAYVEKREDEEKGVRTIWWFESDGIVLAKNRIGLPAKMVDPTWAELEPYFNK